MNRISRRVVGTAVPAVSALAAVVAFGAPAHADVQASVSWEPGADFATVQLNGDAVDAAINYGAGLGRPGLDDLCGKIGGFVNSKRQAAGYTDGLEQSTCVSIIRDCVNTRANDAVQFSVYADLTYRCSSYA